MTENDVLFKFYKPEELSTVAKNQYSYFGWEGKGAFAFFTLADAYKNGANAIYEKIVCSGGRNDIVDTLVYPLCFMYRHSMEILIKYLFVKYYEGGEDELKAFLNANHSLNEMWQQVKPILSNGKKKVGTKINIGAIEHYIQEMAKFDPVSMRMRYPITKKLEAQNSTVWLDIHNLHDRMNEFFNDICQIDYDIDNQVKFQVSDDDIEMYLKKYTLAKDRVTEFIELMSEFAKNEETELKMVSFSELVLDSDAEEVTKISYLDGLTSDDKIIIETLYYTGRNVHEGLLRLSSSPKDKIADFVKGCINQMQMEYFEFGKEIDSVRDMNICGKVASSIVKNLKTAIEILR